MIARVVSVLLVSSDQTLVDAMEASAAPIGGVRVEVMEEIDGACDRVEREGVAMVVMHLPHDGRLGDVTRLVRMIACVRPKVPMLVVCDRDCPPKALTLLRQGVTDVLSRPLDLDRLSFLMEVLTVDDRIGAGRTAPAEVPAPRPGVRKIEGEQGELPFLFCPDSKLGKLMEKVQRVATRDATILLGGETGTGKSRLARVIHQLSDRRDEPFLAINCGALTATLIESEMFGHVKGAFTGADADRVGKFAAVGGGTLFLDEVDSLPLALQAKLLRAVEERVFEPVGSNRTQPMKARLIAACNRPLEQEVAQGRFRSDLYYRLNVIGFELPPIRERQESIPELTRTILASFAERQGRPAPTIDAATMAALKAHAWPGNIRELRNVLERALVLCEDDRIRLDDLPESFLELAPKTEADAPPAPAANTDGATLVASREHAERHRIVKALHKHGNNRLRAAAELGISRMTLYNKLHKLGMI